MAECSLGWNINDEIDDDDMLDSVDADAKAEEDSLRGVNLNPVGFEYKCFAPDISALEEFEATCVGLVGHSCQINERTFQGTAEDFQRTLTQSVELQKECFQNGLFDATEHEKKNSELDPTQ